MSKYLIVWHNFIEVFFSFYWTYWPKLKSIIALFLALFLNNCLLACGRHATCNSSCGHWAKFISQTSTNVTQMDYNLTASSAMTSPNSWWSIYVTCWCFWLLAVLLKALMVCCSLNCCFNVLYAGAVISLHLSLPNSKCVWSFAKKGEQAQARTVSLHKIQGLAESL